MSADQLRVLAVTTWGIACGISEYARLLAESISPKIEIIPHNDLDPYSIRNIFYDDYVIWLNYQMALHSQWTPEMIEHYVRSRRMPVVVTLHDTGVPNSDQAKAIHAVASATIVHEPAEDLPKAIYLRQGVPAAQPRTLFYGKCDADRTDITRTQGDDHRFLGWWDQPILGSVGFPFPWKNYDLLAEATALAGWALLLIAPGATAEQVSRWRRLNPWSRIVTEFIPGSQVVSDLSGCDATAFLYACANTGTSGAIRQGIAARKPVLATEYPACRQFRDLWVDTVGIRWLDSLSVAAVAGALGAVPIQRVDPMIVALAEQDSWTTQAARYADIFRAAYASR